MADMRGAGHGDDPEAMDKIQVLIAHGHRMVAEALRNTLFVHGGFGVDISDCLDSTLSALRPHRNDNMLVMIDTTMPGLQGLRSVRQVIEAVPNGSVVLFSDTADADFLWRAMDLGAKGLILTSQPLRGLPTTLQLINDGNKFVPTSLSRLSNLSAAKYPPLSETEVFTLRAAAEGKTNKAIALELNVSERFIKIKMHAIYQRLKARNRAHAVILASKANLI